MFNWNDSNEEMQFARSLAKEFDIDYLGFEITAGDIASKKFSRGSKEFDQLQKSEYSIQKIYRNILKKEITRKAAGPYFYE